MSLDPSIAEITQPVEWVKGARLSELTGITVKAMDRKRQRNVWKEGVHYRKIDGGIYYSISAYNAWVSGQTIPASSSTVRRYVSRSRSIPSVSAKR